MTIKHIYACACGHNTEVAPEAFNFGSVMQCQKCGEVRARVRPVGGGDAWIKVADDDVAFYHLLDMT